MANQSNCSQLRFEHRGGSGAKKLARMASTVAFELNKATLKLRRSLHISDKRDSSKRADEPGPSSTQRSAKGENRCCQMSSSFSTSRGSMRNRQLCAELSSFALYPLFGALTTTHFSSPNLLFQTDRRSKLKILELNDSIFLKIMDFLDAQSMLAASQTCQRLRYLALRKDDEFFDRRDVTSHEIVISYNRIVKKTQARMLRKERSRYDTVFKGATISSLLCPFTRALTKITFESNVSVSDWIREILELHDKQKLVPLALSFTGGALTRGNQLGGADLRNISETEFIKIVGRLQPHLQEVQLATSRLFKTSTSPPRLLGLISMLTTFGVVYERPLMRFFFDEIVKIVSYWRNDVQSRSCDIYMRRPLDADIDSWNKLGTVDDYRIDPLTEEFLVSKVTIKHSFLVHIDLVFHFH
ncbi:unnamed protein product [Caenorhabditis bovis]|uniref:F-box domain-containing protein n=1 Tax=Caenorhabditis bovis TaxID=2654633 RepID=A0A8S1FB83_9PELO|nr:unnamed protein product [Caenorhabditis bovis]